MTELSAANAGDWLARNGIEASQASFSELGGGVSNKVILASGPGVRLVVKQSLGKLRVEQEWLSDRSRIFREAAAMRWLEGRVRGGRIPKAPVEDRCEFAIAMEAAPPGAEMWKEKLFRGEADLWIARAAGAMLASIISVSWNHPEAREIFGDQTVFDQLRVDPYYRFTAARHPPIARYFNELIQRSEGRRVSLVHGDWSPKNLLASPDELWAIDWEVIHFGDPSFDAGFLLNHLLLKSIAMPPYAGALRDLAMEFTCALESGLPAGGDWIVPAALEHLPALLLARVDGKSPVEYLDETGVRRARQLAFDLIRHPVGEVMEIFAR